jgi:Flp pilus assembly protein TadG
MNLRQLRYKVRGEKGQSILELALILPVMMMLIFGITEFGRAWMTMNVLTGAVREGARVASVTPNLASNRQVVIDVVTGLLADANLEPAYVVIRPEPSMDNMVQVTAAVNFFFTPVLFVKHIFGTNIMMVRSASCYYEGQV